MAEGEGFEPSIRFPAYTLSKRAPSATRPPLRGALLTILKKRPRQRKINEAQAVCNGYYAAMRFFFYFGLILVGCSFMLAAAETAWHSMPGSVHGFIVQAHDLWYTLWPASLIIFEIRVERLFGAWAWDPVMLTFLKLPAWLIFGAPGVVLLISFRPNQDPKSIEEIAMALESLELYDHLTKLALEENPPGEEHGPHDILPENPYQDNELEPEEEKA